MKKSGKQWRNWERMRMRETRSEETIERKSGLNRGALDDEKWRKTIDERPPPSKIQSPELISFHARFANLLSNDKWKNVGTETGYP